MKCEETILVHPAGEAMRLLLDWSGVALERLRDESSMLQLGRIRGSGPGVSFRAMVDRLEQAYPLRLRFPFEGSERVGGAVWMPAEVLGEAGHPAAIAKLHWRAGADDLPMHIHEHADRFIVVLEGRGFFHWTHQRAGEFDGSAVKTIAARERDVFVFRRGLVHTFSTDAESMTLLSVQSPFLPFDAPEQYALPARRWTRGDSLEGTPDIVCQLSHPSSL